jgi:enamine deaminase RidA (YjgF/YER057c/UK114 family)
MSQTIAAVGNAASTRVTPVVVHDGIAYVSGQLPRIAGDLRVRGKVGAEIDLERAREAARLCAEACIAQLARHVGEANILRVLKITGFVASARGFNQQGAVIDAASDVFLERFGADSGAHARSAVGVAELPHDASVEIEMVAAVKRTPPL